MFFDDLGPPWPLHSCLTTETTSIIEQLIDVYGTVNDQILNDLKAHAREKDLEFDSKQLATIEHFLKHGKNAPFRIQVTPGNDSATVVGEITNIDRKINFFKRFDMPKSDIATKLLGILGKEEFNEMHLLVQDHYSNEYREYKVIIASKLSDQLKLAQKIKIASRIVVHEVVGKSKIWMIDEIEILN
ncbi:MAG: hypothetical protein K9J12_06165 [Melioribacteraceae bacterium]|nr:hypothetical protein [Melioribacteraceae bacterium]MCF8431952.1 hypothetical protein [Melioribacteraceae bacterium]